MGGMEHDGDGESWRREIGARIAQARKEHGGMRQEDLANRLGISVRSMQGYEHGEVVPYNRIAELSRILGRPAEWFLHGETTADLSDIHAMLVTLQRTSDHTNFLLERLLAKLG